MTAYCPCGWRIWISAQFRPSQKPCGAEFTEALRRRVEHGIFGYTRVPDTYYDAVTGWFGRRHGWKIEKDWIIYTTGVVPALSAIIRAMTSPGDKVLIQGPVYNCFYSTVRNNGCETVSSSLIYGDRTYRMDFEDLERKASDPAVKLMLLCNPHNPAGRVWTREELTRLGRICLRHGITVISDEIHCELTCPGYTYTPFASICEDFQRSLRSGCRHSRLQRGRGMAAPADAVHQGQLRLYGEFLPRASAGLPGHHT